MSRNAETQFYLLRTSDRIGRRSSMDFFYRNPTLDAWYLGKASVHEIQGMVPLVEWTYGTALADFHSCSAWYLVSERFLNVVQEHGLTGCEFTPLRAKMPKNGPEVPMFAMAIRGWAGLVDVSKEEFKKGRDTEFFRYSGYRVVESSWDGCDFFSMASGRFVSQRAQRALLAESLLGIRSVPFEEVEYTRPFLTGFEDSEKYCYGTRPIHPPEPEHHPRS